MRPDTFCSSCAASAPPSRLPQAFAEGKVGLDAADAKMGLRRQCLHAFSERKEEALLPQDLLPLLAGYCSGAIRATAEAEAAARGDDVAALDARLQVGFLGTAAVGACCLVGQAAAHKCGAKQGGSAGQRFCSA